MHPRAKTNSANASGAGKRFWTAERKAKASELADLGLSMSEAAAEIGDGCTKGMLAGQAKAMGIKFHGYEKFRSKNRARWLRYRIGKLQLELNALEASETVSPAPPFCVSRETSEAA